MGMYGCPGKRHPGLVPGLVLGWVGAWAPRAESTLPFSPLSTGSTAGAQSGPGLAAAAQVRMRAGYHSISAGTSGRWDVPGPGEGTSPTWHSGLMRPWAQVVPGFPAILPGESPLEGLAVRDGGMGVLVGIRIASFSHMTSMMYLCIAVMPSVFWVAVPPLVILQDLPSSVCFIPAMRTANPEGKFSAKAARDCVTGSISLFKKLCVAQSILARGKAESGLAQQQRLLCGSLFASRWR